MKPEKKTTRKKATWRKWRPNQKEQHTVPQGSIVFTEMEESQAGCSEKGTFREREREIDLRNCFNLMAEKKSEMLKDEAETKN